MSSWQQEYPRPQLRRSSFLSLNGAWELNGQHIVLPFPPQSSASGFAGEIGDHLHYERRFMLPAGFYTPADRVLLHFGAVDQTCEVFVNGISVAAHEGGYLPFSVDITRCLRAGENVLIVEAVDTLSHFYPYGKQRKNRGGMWYTPVSGIWQSVWMEAVPEKYIEQIHITPDMQGIDLQVTTKESAFTVEIPLTDGVYRQTFDASRPARINFEQPWLWSPEDPHLYQMTITAGRDKVETYFALRTISFREINGIKRLCLNDQPVFLNGLLDQGYFEDGIYLPASPDSYAQDVKNMQELGFNLLRKHIKIEPERFYYECDRRGMLVMQDMVNAGSYNFLRDTALPTIGLQRLPDRWPWGKKRKAFFEQHCLDTLRHLHNHPCVIAYTIFNEGWGQFDADRMYEVLKAADPTRFYDATSGWFTQKKSDVDSLHIYFRNETLRPGKRPMLLSECGGYTRAIEGHMFNPDRKYGYGKTDSEEALTAMIGEMYEKMVLPAIPLGLTGVIYTQVSDVEDEINGLYTYDRSVCKVNKDGMRALAQQVKDALTAAVKA